MNILWFLKPKPTYHSKINGTITIGILQKNKALFSGGVTQSGGEIKPMWDKVIENLYRCHPEFISGSLLSFPQKRESIHLKKIPGQARNDNKKQILILGVGGGSVIQAIRNHDKKANITGVELDSIMIQVAKEQFDIKEVKNQQFIIGDAIDYLINQTKPKSFDLIVVDLYIGPLNPPKSRKREFLEKLHEVLKPHGMVVYNAHYQKQNVNEYAQFRKLIDSVFPNVTEVFSYPLNRVLLMHSQDLVEDIK